MFQSCDFSLYHTKYSLKTGAPDYSSHSDVLVDNWVYADVAFFSKTDLYSNILTSDMLYVEFSVFYSFNKCTQRT